MKQHIKNATKSAIKETCRVIAVAAYAGLIGFGLTAGFYSFMGYMAWLGD